MRRSALSATALASVLLVSVTSGAESRVPVVPDREVYAEQYLSILCPLNVEYEQMNRSLDRWERTGSTTIGAPVPGFARKAFREMTEAYDHAAQRMKQVPWPDIVDKPADRITQRFVSGVGYYGSRDTHRVKPSWKNKMDSAGSAPEYMRRLLELPPVGKGCGRRG